MLLVHWVHWRIGAWWCIGALVHWCIGALVHWFISACIVHWRIGAWCIAHVLSPSLRGIIAREGDRAVRLLALEVTRVDQLAFWLGLGDGLGPGLGLGLGQGWG